jgi:tetratricopeptide (TPR) repeat protein/CHAT domain-containing protein
MSEVEKALGVERLLTRFRENFFLVYFFLFASAVASASSSNSVETNEGKIQDWHFYEQLIRQDKWDDFGSINGLAFYNNFWPLIQKQGRRTDPEFLMVCGAGLANWAYRSELSEDQKKLYYQAAIKVLARAADANNLIALQELAWMTSDGLGRERNLNEAIRLSERRVNIATGQFGAKSKSAGEALYATAMLVYRSKDFTTALALTQRAMEILDRDSDIDDATRAAMLNNFAEINSILRRYSSALPLYQRAQSLISGQTHLQNLAAITGNLANCYRNLGRYADAEKETDKALEIFGRGPPTPYEFVLRRNLAQMEQKEGRSQDAMQLLTDSLLRLATVASIKSNESKLLLSDISVLYRASSDAEAAESLERLLKVSEGSLSQEAAGRVEEEVSRFWIQRLSNSDPKAVFRSAGILMIMGHSAFPELIVNLLNDDSSIRKIIPLMLSQSSKRDVKDLISELGNKNPYVRLRIMLLLEDLGLEACDQLAKVARGDEEALREGASLVLARIATVYMPRLIQAMEDYQKGPAQIEAAVEAVGLVRYFGADASACIPALEALTNSGQADLNAIALASLRDVQNAVAKPKAEGDVSHRLYALLRNPDLIGRERIRTAEAFIEVRKKLWDAERYQECLVASEMASEYFEQALGIANLQTLTSLAGQAAINVRLGRIHEAEDLCYRIFAVYDANPSLNSDEAALADALNDLASVYLESGRREAAEPLFRRIVDLYEKKYGPDSSKEEMVVALHNLGACYRKLGRYEEAAVYMRRAVNATKKSDDLSDRLVAEILNTWGMLLLETDHPDEAKEVLERCVDFCRRAPTLGPLNPETGVALDNLGLVLQKTGDLGEALSDHQAALQIFEHAPTRGPEHEDTAICLLNLGRLEVKRESYDTARAFFERALKIRERVFGSESPQALETLSYLSEVYEKLGDHAASENAAERLTTAQNRLKQLHIKLYEDIRNEIEESRKWIDAGEWVRAAAALKRGFDDLRTGAGEQPAFIPLVLRLAESYEEIADFDSALMALEELRRLCEMEPVQFSSEMIQYWTEKGTCLGDKGLYIEAERALNEALKLLRSRNEVKEIAFVETWSALGGLSTKLGNYDKATAWYEQAGAILEKEPTQSAAYATCLANLAQLAKEKGDLGKAESLFERALSIQNSDKDEILHALGVFYYEIGYYDQALPIFLKEIDSYKARFGPDHPRTVGVINDAGENFAYLGRYNDAEVLLSAAVESSLRLRPKEVTTAEYMMNLAELYVNEGKESSGLTLYEKALSIANGFQNGKNSIGAEILRQIGMLEASIGQLNTAEKELREAAAVLEAIHGPSSLRTANVKFDLGQVLLLEGKDADALAILEEAWESYGKCRRDVFAFSTTREQLVYAKRLYSFMDLILKTACESKAQSTEWARFAASVLLSSKGAALDAMSSRHRVVSNPGDAELKKLSQEWEFTVRSLLAVTFDTSLGEQANVDPDQVAELRRRSEELEKELSRKSAGFVAESRTTSVLDSVLNSLSETTSLVEYAKYRDAETWKYAAIVIRRAAAPLSDVQVVPLAEAAVIEDAVAQWREAVVQSSITNRVYSEPEALHKVSATLARLIFEPIRPSLVNSLTILISPDSELSFVSFAALPGRKDLSFLIEDYDLAYVTSGRDLLRPRESAQGNPVVVGEPDFGAIVRLPSKQPDYITEHRKLPPDPALSGNSSNFQGLYFEYDDGMQAEADAIETLLRNRGMHPKRLQMQQASKKELEKIKSPSILHFATHGFFLSDLGFKNAFAAPGSRGIGGTRPARLTLSSDADQSRSRQAISEELMRMDPMQRSGIALAGINDTLIGTKPAGGDDGILTATDVCRLDLRGTQLVVISTCESGLGQALNGEGVFGLRRAFAVAGADNLIMSLWEVADEPTKLLMLGMYKALEKGMTPPQSLLAAQRAWIQEVRHRGEYPHPFFWAGFVSSGSGRVTVRDNSDR